MKILILGDGSAGRRHAGHLAKKRAKRVDFEQYKIETHSVTVVGPNDDGLRLRQEGFDAVVIATPPEFHQEALEWYTQAHILCEGPCTWLPKPNSRSVRMMASNWRFVPALQNLKQRLTQPLLAHLWFDHDLTKWRKDWDYKKSCYYWSGHDLINVHELDLAFWFFGPAERISIEKLHTGRSRACDGFQVLIRHQSGTLTTIASSWHSQHYRRGMYIVQRDGTVEELAWKTPEDDPVVNASYEKLIDHWLDHIERGDPLVEPSLEDGFRAYKALQGEVY